MSHLPKVTQQSLDFNGAGFQFLHPKSWHCVSLEKIADAFLCLSFSFALVSDKRYQRKEPVISSVHSKIKGIAEVKKEIMENGQKKVVQSVFDMADYTFPLQVSTCQHPPRSHPWSLSPGPLPPPLGPRDSLQKNIGPI